MEKKPSQKNSVCDCDIISTIPVQPHVMTDDYTLDSPNHKTNYDLVFANMFLH